MIRAIYIAKKENENPGVVGYFKNPIYKPFSSLFLNSIRKNNDTGFDWIWEDFSGKKDLEVKKEFFTKYVNRSAFYDYDSPLQSVLSLLKKPKTYMILTSEELATLFHLPGTVVETPSFERISATKSQPPQDLPI